MGWAGVVATSFAGWLVVVFTGLTALASVGVLAVNLIAHVHDRALSGTSRPVIARSASPAPNIEFTSENARKLGIQGDDTHARGVLLGLINRSPRHVGVTFVRGRCWFTPWMEVRGEGSVRIDPNNPAWFPAAIIVRWRWLHPGARRKWITVTFMTETGTFRFRGRARLFRP